MKKELETVKSDSRDQQIDFIQALEILSGDLPKRAQEIILSRFGVTGKKGMTLEEIGQKYDITRERVRQVIREVFKKIKEKNNDPVFNDINEKIKFTLEKNNGIMSEKDLLAFLKKDDVQQQGAIRFFLECFENFPCLEIKDELRKSYTLADFDLRFWREVKNKAKEVLKNEGQPLESTEFFKKINEKDLKFDEKLFFDYLVVSEEIGKNNFGKWGMINWKEVSPKGTREKSFLVLKEAGKPLHFKVIAAQIDKYNLNKKKTHPQTVHNELIKDKNFVLVGRGMYALSEWGYKKGTVRDVITEILTKSDNPLKREEILKKVMEVRQVKKSTIIINLNNFFKKTKE